MTEINMWNKIKTQFKRFRRWIIFAVLGISIAFAAGELPKEALSTEFNFNGKIIKTEYTDDNTNENLIIRTDKSHYGGWNATEIFFSIENISKNTELADIQFYFAGEEILASISELKKDIPYQITVNDYGEVDYWDEELQATTTRQAVIGTHKETRYKDHFYGLALAESKTFTQDIPVNFKANKKAVYNIPAGEIKFFRAKIEFVPKSEGEFLIYAESVNNRGKLDPWYSSSYTYKRTITLEADEISTTTDNFPVLATTTEDYLKTTTHSGKIESDDGYDIVFVDTDDATLLDFEYEKYASTTGELVVWIKVDISSTTDKVINMYYGNNGASDISSTTGVWDDNFVMVQHLQETPAGTTYDSTSNDNDGTTSGMDSADQVAGQIDGSLDFDGGDDYVNTNSGGANDLVGGASGATISSWVKITEDATRKFIFHDTWSDAASTRLRLEVQADETAIVGVRDTSEASQETVVTDNAISTGILHYIVTTIDIANDNIEIYIDGIKPAQAGSVNFAGTDFNADNTTWTNIGAQAGTNSHHFNGLIDEVRISNVARTAGWIETEYNNQSDVGAFLTFGAEEEDEPAPTPSGDFIEMLIFE